MHIPLSQCFSLSQQTILHLYRQQPVVITTKSGKGGSGLGISFSQTFGIDHAYKTPDIQTVYGDGPYVGRYDADGDGNIWQPTQFQVNSAGQHTLIGTWGTGFGLPHPSQYAGSIFPNMMLKAFVHRFIHLNIH